MWAVIGSQDLKQASWINEAWRARSEARVTQQRRNENGLGRRKEKGESTTHQARWRIEDRKIGLLSANAV